MDNFSPADSNSSKRKFFIIIAVLVVLLIVLCLVFFFIFNSKGKTDNTDSTKSSKTHFAGIVEMYDVADQHNAYISVEKPNAQIPSNFSSDIELFEIIPREKDSKSMIAGYLSYGMCRTDEVSEICYNYLIRDFYSKYYTHDEIGNVKEENINGIMHCSCDSYMDNNYDGVNELYKHMEIYCIGNKFLYFENNYDDFHDNMEDLFNKLVKK